LQRSVKFHPTAHKGKGEFAFGAAGTMTRKWYLYAALPILAIGIYLGFSYWIFSHVDPDPLCTIATTKYRMKCTVLASLDVYDAGSLYSNIRTDTKDSTGYTFGIPTSKVFIDSCATSSGIRLPHLPPTSPMQLQIGEITYDVNYNLVFGVNARLPQFSGLGLQLGPQANKLRHFKLRMDHAEVLEYDTAKFHDTVRGCSLRSTCQNLANDSNSLIVSRVLIARNLRYEIVDDVGTSMSLKGALDKGLLSANAEGGISSKLTQNIADGGDFVFAVDFFANQPIESSALCDKEFYVTDVTGSTSVSVATPDDTPDNDAKFTYPKTNNCSPTQQTVDIGLEACAGVRHNIEDRKGNESFDPAEASISAITKIDANSGTISFNTYAVTIAGTRANSDIPNAIHIPFANASTKSRHNLEFNVSNRTDHTIKVSGTLRAETKTRNGLLFGGPWRMVKVLTKKDGLTEEKPFIWLLTDHEKESVLVELGPGSGARIEMEYLFENKSADAEVSGGSDDEITITMH
jgi:hypothetical protein